MLTATSLWEFDKDRIYKTYELPAGARVKVHYVRKEEWKEPVEWDCIAIFKYMDWMYWYWYSEEDWKALIFNWEFKQIWEDEFTFYNEEEWAGTD